MAAQTLDPVTVSIREHFEHAKILHHRDTRSWPLPLLRLSAGDRAKLGIDSRGRRRPSTTVCELRQPPMISILGPTTRPDSVDYFCCRNLILACSCAGS